MGAKLVYIAFKILQKFISLFPRRVNFIFAKILGGILFYLVKSRRKLALKNIKLSLDISEADAKKVTKGVFEDLVIKFFETITLDKWSDSDYKDRIEVEGIEHLEEAYNQNKGIVLFTGHIGNWEILGVYLSLLGYPMNAIARMYQNPDINNEILRIRESKGAKVFSREAKGVKNAFKALLKKELLFILADQDAHRRGIFIEFFNRPASTPMGPVTMAQKTGALIVPIYLLRDGLKYELVVERAVGIDKDASEEDFKETLQNISSSLERKIKECPQQWLWLHRRWKTKIEGDFSSEG